MLFFSLSGSPNKCLTVQSLHGQALPGHLAQYCVVKATCRRSLRRRSNLVPEAVGTENRPAFCLGADTSFRSQSTLATSNQQIAWRLSSCPSFLPFGPPDLPACTAPQRTSTQSRAGSTLSWLPVPRRDSRSSRPSPAGTHFKHATPHPHTRQGCARLHASTGLPVGPRIAIPACGRGNEPGDRQSANVLAVW